MVLQNKLDNHSAIQRFFRFRGRQTFDVNGTENYIRSQGPIRAVSRASAFSKSSVQAIRSHLSNHYLRSKMYIRCLRLQSARKEMKVGI